MRAVEREHLQLFLRNPPNPARNVRRIAVPRADERVAIRRKARLALRKLGELTKGHPCQIGSHLVTPRWSEDVAEDWGCEKRGSSRVNSNPGGHEHSTAGERFP